MAAKTEKISSSLLLNEFQKGFTILVELAGEVGAEKGLELQPGLVVVLVTTVIGAELGDDAVIDFGRIHAFRKGCLYCFL